MKTKGVDDRSEAALFNQKPYLTDKRSTSQITFVNITDNTFIHLIFDSILFVLSFDESPLFMEGQSAWKPILFGLISAHLTLNFTQPKYGTDS